MRVCDWCHGAKSVDRVPTPNSNTIDKSSDLCSPCRTAMVKAVNDLRREREKLRPKSILNEEV